MPIHSILIQGYRSLVRFPMRLGRITVVTGPNGSGKSNLYRALHLIHRAAHGEFARALTEEGGVESALWSGPIRPGQKRKRELTLQVRRDELTFQLVAGVFDGRAAEEEMDWQTMVRFGLTMFTRDPDIKTETFWAGDSAKPSTTLLQRKGGRVTLADGEGRREAFGQILIAGESVLSQVKDPGRYPALSLFREELQSWRFYHQFRNDPGSPIRRPCVGTRTPVLDHDGANLAAALQTIREYGDGVYLDGVIEDAFPGCCFSIQDEHGQFLIQWHTPALHRPLGPDELSDGTLRFLALSAALLSPSPPELMVLNEPESSLHPGLIPPLARLIAEASERSQIWIATHCAPLVEELRRLHPLTEYELTLQNGETKVKGKENVVFENLDDEE